MGRPSTSQCAESERHDMMHSDKSLPYAQSDLSERRLGFSPDMQVLAVFVLTLVVGFVCAAASLNSLGLIGGAAATPPPPPPDFEVPTAREAYVPAVEAIRAVDPLAELAAGAGVWTPFINRVQLEAGRTGWTFFFYLPNYGEMAQVVVDRGKVAHVVNRVSWQTPPSLLSDQGWLVDSPQAISRLLEVCRETLNEAGQDARVEVWLSTADEHRTLLWQARVVPLGAPQEACEARVDAVTGALR